MKCPFFVSPYPARPTSPWKLEVRASFAGKKIRRFFVTEAEAWAEGDRMVEQIRKHGIDSLEDNSGVTVQAAVRMFRKESEGKSLSHASKIRSLCTTLEQKFSGSLAHVGPASIDRWLKSLKGSETSKAGTFRYARLFFR
jgi:integrase